MWTLEKTSFQPCAEFVRFSHHRKVPLPLRNFFCIDGAVYTAQYIGHGVSTVAFRLYSERQELYAGLILKVVCPAREDLECSVMKRFNELKFKHA